ncbi:MAG: hypothetical protein NZ930_00365 [Candidatus Bipolaricaulota bacterium]|nr:hypothetical protein [Candidatus Bipolaricaulota bacterium]MDW8031157.1 hypothetical protein [Candidatus Bipolaricaulota bacterium]
MHPARSIAIVLLALAIGWASGLSQTSQTVTVTVNQSLYLDCSAAVAINYTVTQTDIEGPQPFTIGTWGCNVDSLTNFELSANMTMTSTADIVNASADDFSATCTSASGGGSPSCGPGGTFGPITLGSGGNTAGTPGADFSGNVRLNVSDWDVRAIPPSRSVSGVINYSVTDSTP